MLYVRGWIASGIVAALALGCARTKTTAKVDPSPLANQPRLASMLAPSAPAPRDALPNNLFVVQLDVYQLSVPIGSVSNKMAFWKRVSEDMIDVPTRDVLYLNGFRVGEAPISEWDYFKNLIDENPAVATHQSFIASEAKSIEMAMKKQVMSQCLFVMHPPQEPNGKSFDSCDNIMALSFRPAPRKQGDVRVKLCPMVRSLHKKLEATLLDGQREFQFVAPERLYDLRLEVDVPLDSFLVVAPSEYAKAPMSVGNAFLIKEGATELEEQVLIIVPRVYGATKVAVDTVKAQ